MIDTFFTLCSMAVLLSSCKKNDGEVYTEAIVIRHEKVTSEYVNSRNVDVWLPPDFSKEKKYAVMYMHDGQMLFDSATTWNKQEWRVDEVITGLLEKRKIDECIVVGIWNDGENRYRDYFPEKPISYLSAENRKTFVNEKLNGNPLADEYLLFLTQELKPFIDKEYPTLTDRANTYIMGSSMGGLISMYAICEYPDVFGGAGCISTHWPGDDPEKGNPEVFEAFKTYLSAHLPSPETHKMYFDYGDQTLDQYYKPYQLEVDAIMQQKGFTAKNWITREFIGHDHSEKSWAKRLHIPLVFLMREE